MSASTDSGVSTATMSALRQAIPAHCFEKSYFWSTFYLLRDLAILATLYFVKETVFFAESSWIGYLVWINVTGFFYWCLFVVGHDCGHNSFSDSYYYNQLCGHIAHSILLVPFNGWKISHRLHHTHHNHVSKDHGWKPASEETVKNMDWFTHLVRHSLLSMFLYYWYLLATPFGDSTFLSGNHYNPTSRLFAPSHFVEATVSTTCIVGWLAFLLIKVPLATLFWYYSVPLVIFSFWLSMVTYLHHTHKDVTIFGDSTWSYFKGSVNTVDRSYGWILDYFHHNIETHCVHHIFFSSIPHYHLVEATNAAKSVLGDLYFFDPTPVPTALVTALSGECSYIVKHEHDIYHYVGYDEKTRKMGKPAQK
eukprot:TRINITY_DN13358_c0_g1_i1.p1 TRINITY_DN13358_c0_g1~~TRINITY_DN13358_c0_g1_i1.p1  ORF type:complete len:364 (-),score=51.68 TRINITY_DN13358_c0_g1_i1:57-1148(-)